MYVRMVSWLSYKSVVLFNYTDIFPKFVFAGQMLPGPQDSLLRHRSFSLLCYDRVWLKGFPHSWLLLKGIYLSIINAKNKQYFADPNGCSNTVQVSYIQCDDVASVFNIFFPPPLIGKGIYRRLQCSLYSHFTTLPKKRLWQATNWIQ